MGVESKSDSIGLLNTALEVLNSTDYYHDVVRCFEKIKNYSKELLDHSLNVACISLLIATTQYTSQDELNEIFIAALLHDYGKLYVSKDILEKTGELTEEELKDIRLHPIAGYFYLKEHTNFSDDILTAILEHHEKVDGSGYCSEKKCDAISDFAKIIAVADVYDAMISDRVYRTGIDREEVILYITNNAEKHFDKNIVDAFLSIAYSSDFELVQDELKNNIKTLHVQLQVSNA